MSHPDPGALPPALRSHLTNVARFDVPAGWADRTVHVLTAPPAQSGAADNGAADDTGTAAASITLHPDVPLPGEDLAAYAARQLAGIRAALPGVEVLRQGARAVGRGRGWAAEFRWPGAHGVVRQQQAYVLHAGRVLTWTLTAPEAEYTAHADAFATVLASVHLISPALTIDVAPEARLG